MYTSVVFLVVLLGSPWQAFAQTGPAYCTYTSGLFYCTYAIMPSVNRPIDYTQFSIPPQVMTITASGFVPYIGDTQTFSSTFSTFDKTQMDANVPIVLTISCGRNGAFYLQAGAFYNMSHVQVLKIRDCNIYNIPSYAFDGLDSLDSISIESSTIDYVDPNSMVGSNVEKLTTDTHQPPQLFGHVGLSDARFASGSVPPGFLYSWKNLTSAKFHNANLSIVGSDLFRYNTKIRYIDLSDNLFTSIPSGIWKGLESLSDVFLGSIDWSCTCSELWFVEYARQNNITIFGDLICSTGGMTATKYYYANCEEIDPCDGMMGFAMGSQCQTLLGTIRGSVAVVSLIFIIVALILTVMNLRVVPGHNKRRGGSKGRSLAKNRWKEATKKDKTSKSKSKNRVAENIV